VVTAALAALGGVLGLVAGSFLNVVVYRVPRGLSVVSPRSHCPACEHPIRARDNIPLASWLLLRGRCRDCGARISIRYLLVEAGVAGAFAALAVLVGPSWTLPAYWWLGAVAVALGLIDLEVRRIPNRVLVPGALVGTALLGCGSLLDGTGWYFLRAVAGGSAYFAVLLLVALAARGGFGLGDVKFGFLLGEMMAYRSWATVVVGGFAAFMVGGLIALVLLAARRAGRKDLIPFGPAMVAGAAFALAVGDAVARWYLG
jgi:leader peptidase (prepilin peptidase)/N-methyltransferase